MSRRANNGTNKFLILTEQGKILGTLWGFGGLERYDHNISNSPTKNISIEAHLGTMAYKHYMTGIGGKNPQFYPQKIKPINSQLFQAIAVNHLSSNLMNQHCFY